MRNTAKTIVQEHRENITGSEKKISDEDVERVTKLLYAAQFKTKKKTDAVKIIRNERS